MGIKASNRYIPPEFEALPAERAKVVAKALGAFDALHPDKRKAAAIMGSTHDYIDTTTLEAVTPKQQSPLPLPPTEGKKADNPGAKSDDLSIHKWFEAKRIAEYDQNNGFSDAELLQLGVQAFPKV